MSTTKAIFRFTKKFFLVVGVLLVVFVVYFLASIYVATPEIKDKTALNFERRQVNTNYYKIGNNWLKKSQSGLWEMYLEGDGFERGVINGKLTKELAEQQETAFINQIKKIVPSRTYLNFLKYFVAYFNRNLTKHVTDEYQQEIYGVSLSASDKYDALAPKYYRILNYHAAHDIGHALQDKNMAVGCTSFGVWNDKSENNKLLIGRSFDFYSGDEFAKNKIAAFIKPTTGYKYMYITWAGFTGVVSGMNDKGLTVTLNAAKSDIPTGAATPISLLAKEILQYAKNIKEAYVIAKKRETFVSESILVGSAEDNKAYIIEKTPTKINLYQEDRNELVCPNHYQSEAFAKDINNNKNIVESSSMYRKYRMGQLVDSYKTVNYKNAAAILRDTKGINNRDIGLGNEKAINQLIAHHAVVFSPQERLVWVSTQPFQLGQFVCYDLTKVFAEAPSLKTNKEINESNLTILADTFLQTKTYKKFVLFKKIKDYIRFCTNCKYPIKVDEDILQAFVQSNPNSYYTYQIIGDYYKKAGEKKLALNYYKMALSKEIATNKERQEIQKQIAKLNL
ncbi:MAG TPA: C45 family peptidase [Bacteroidia bacterium]|nr:C45 family peptidase [Bacteroidia bacterium]